MIKILKKIIKKIINKFGYEIHPRNIKKGRMLGFSESLNFILKLGFKPKTIIDVGAAFGTMPLYI